MGQIPQPQLRGGIAQAPGAHNAMSEAFSYLGEAAARPESPDIVRQLAEALGVTFR